MDRDSIEKKIRAAIERRTSLAAGPDEAYRLFNSAGDGIDGLIIDRYGAFCLVQFFREDLESLAEAVHVALCACDTGFDRRGVLLKRRMKSDCADPQTEYMSELLSGEFPSDEYTVRQNGILMKVDLVRGMNTGLFLDMRSVRDRLSSVYADAAPRRVLNLFCYTGAFSVHALKHGASSCINVDTSRTVLGRAMENYKINGITPPQRDFVCMDAAEYLRYAARKSLQFDHVIFDPPTFSRGKKGSFSVKSDYPALLDAIAGVAAGGLVLSVINTHSVPDRDYFSLHPSSWEQVFFANEPDDFPPAEDCYLKAGLWRVKK
jgi:23S rRNA (cytosine1962-C5)-methyltransferase